MKFIKNFVAASLSVSAILLFLVQGAKSQWLKDGSEEPREDHAEDALKWFYGMRSFGLGYIPQDAWLNAIKQKDALRNKYFPNRNGYFVQSPFATQATVNWTNVGPINIQQGNNPPTHAGRVNTIVGDPLSGKIAYLGAANGGVWKTINAGKSWKPLMDNALSLAMGALAIDPTNSNVLYAGTGEYSKGVGAFFGAGILKSTDAGVSWNSIGLPNVGAFSTIIVNPHRVSTIYAAGAGSGGGLYISDNSGVSWAKLSGGLPPGDVTDLSYVQSGGNDILYAAIPSHGVWLSKDGGKNWTDLQAPFTQMRRVHVAVDPNNWKDAVVLSVNFAGGLEGIFQTTDGGVTWPNDLNNGLDGGTGLFGSNNQGWYDAFVRRHPLKPESILVGGISVWKTDNSGASWDDVGRAYQGGIHPDQHTAAILHSSDISIVYSGSDGGIAVSTDDGSNYTIYQDSLAITESYGIAIDQTVADVTYTGNQDNGTLVGGRSGEWQEIGGGDGGTVIVDAANHNNVYYTIPGKIDVFPNNSSGLDQSDSVGWVLPLVQDENKHHLYTGTQFLYVETAGAASWTKRGKKLASQSYLSAIAPAGDGKTLLVGTTGGKVWSTVDNGITFTDRSTGLPGRDVTSIKVSPTDTKTFYVALSGFGTGHVFKTTDLGAKWQDISSTLPDISCNALVVDAEHPTDIYVGTDVGVFFSPNDGADWIPFGTGLPNVAVTDIAYHKTNRVIRAGTHGRSMWEAPMAATISGITTPTVSNVWYIGESAQIGWYGTASPVKIEISTDNASSWKLVKDGATGNNFTIGDVRFPPVETALIRITDGTQTLQSQMFRIRTRSAGTTLSTFSEQQLYMYDIAYDKDDNILWVTNFNPGDNKIYKIDPNTGTRSGSISVSGGRDFTGIKYDPSTKHLFVHQSNTSTSSSFVFELDVTGKVINKWASPSTYGTGIFVAGDSLFLADRNHNVIHVVSKQDPSNTYYDIDLAATGRVAPFGPRCITLDPATGNLLHTWTDFQGTDANATLYDSYILRLKRDEGTELGSYFVQDGTNSGTNVRGLELDPRAGGISVWVTVLNSGNSSKILKITLVDGPKDGVTSIQNKPASFGASYPNPFTDYTTLLYFTEREGSVKLLIRDMLGREVYATASQLQSSGDHLIILPLQSLPGGRYFCELYINGIRSDIKALVKE